MGDKPSSSFAEASAEAKDEIYFIELINKISMLNEAKVSFRSSINIKYLSR